MGIFDRLLGKRGKDSEVKESTEKIDMKGIQTLEELCSRGDILNTTDWVNRAVEELKPYGREGSCALAKLVMELLNCRSSGINYALMAAEQLEPTQELIEAMQAVTTAPNLTHQPTYSRFTPEIVGGGKIGWTDGTASRIKNYATNVLEKLKTKDEGFPVEKRMSKEEKYEKANENELDNWIEKLEFIPTEYQEELTRGLIRSLGPGEMKLACLCLKRSKDYFGIELDENIKVKIRVLTTETPCDYPIIASYVKVFDSEDPGVDEYFHSRDKHLKRMLEQDHTYLMIADEKYKIHFRRKINFDNVLRDDLNKIRKAFEKYGGVSEKAVIGEIPGYAPAMNWYQMNVSPNDINRKYF